MVLLYKNKATEIGKENFRSLSKIHENRESFVLYNFCHLWYKKFLYCGSTNNTYIHCMHIHTYVCNNQLSNYFSGCDHYTTACLTLNVYDEFTLGAIVGMY